MTKRILLAAAALLAVSGPTMPAQASNCAVDEFDHNGSTMEAQVCDGGNLSISYIRPRSGLRNLGVGDGTLLFDGFEQGGGRISGQARLFSRRCGVITYTVSGSKNSAGTIVLSGSAPVRNNNCQVARYRTDRLVFTLLGGAPQTSTNVAPSCPAGFVLSGGQCVRQATSAPTPTCPAGFVYSRGQCVRTGGPAPSPRPHTPNAGVGDWYAIAGSFRSRLQAQQRKDALGFGWIVMNTNQCPNFTNGFWIAAAGPYSKQDAQAYSGGAGHFRAYVKTCH